MWYTVNNETGEKIDSFMTLEDAVDAIRMYETYDKIDGSYREDFYDVYNDTYDLYAHGDWTHVYELAILCADYCTKGDADKCMSMKWKMVTYYKELNGNEDSITDYFIGSVRRAIQIRKNCEKLCNELVKRKIYRNYRIVLEKERR